MKGHLKRNWFLFLVLLIEGGSLMAVELLGAKLLAPFYGNSLYVWTAVFATTVFSLTLGYFFGGILSEKIPSIKLLFIIISISAFLTFMLPHTAKTLIQITREMNLHSGILITSFFLITPPLICFGIVGPLVVALLSVDIKTLGKTAGLVYFTSTIGGIVSTFLFGFFMIPIVDMKMSAYYTSFALLALPLISLVEYFSKKSLSGPKAEQPVKTDPSVPVETQENDLNDPFDRTLGKSWYLFAFIEGAVVMAIEMLVVGMISPYFGSGLYVWGSVIGITFIGLAIAYYGGGYLGDKYPRMNTLYMITLVSSVFIMILPKTAEILISLFVNAPPVMSVIIMSSILLIIPLGLIGMTPTLLIRIHSKNIKVSGKTTGNVFTISSVGGIFSIILTGYWIIPNFGISSPTFVIGIIAGTIPFILLVIQKKHISAIFIIAFFFGISFLKNNTMRSKDIDVRHYSEGLLGQILVADITKRSTDVRIRPVKYRVLFVNRMGQTFINLKNGRSRWDYTEFIASAAGILPERSNVLLLGLGGGTIANMLENQFQHKVDAVELDERMLEIAKDYFDLSDKVNTVVDDARHYIETTDKKYDLIIFDLFKGETPPAHVLSSECFIKTGSLLNKGGFIMINFNGFVSGENGLPCRSLYKTLVESGFQTKTLFTAGTEQQRNSLFIASANDIFDKFSNSSVNYQGREKLFINEYFNMDSVLTGNEIVFKDNKPCIDKLNINAARLWRNDYNEAFTNSFMSKGIPIFK
ncbi:MAG: spermidine synthase [Candidatus Delongbacteria bacterium]|nr:spermidine synthase [Candidatus Delongbacteria bacterium]